MSAAAIERVQSAAYVIPTDQPESDGTLRWDHTTLVTAEVSAGGEVGLGFTYCAPAAVSVIGRVLTPAIMELEAMAIPTAWARMRAAVRNLGQAGIAFSAISAVDCALWDLKAKLLRVPLVQLLGAARERVPVYGSGGFTSYSEAQLCEQLGRWSEQGFRFVKMKVGRDPDSDVARVRAVRRAIRPPTQLFVDANGAYNRKQALAFAEAFAAEGVSWFEEPVSSDDLSGLALLKNRAPAGMQIAAGEYGYAPHYFRQMLEAEAVDVIQADVTRCGGITGLLGVGALVTARSSEMSSHCAPALHLHAACALTGLCHMEYFHDHVRIENMLFDGCPQPQAGLLAPDRSRYGHGLTLKRADAQRYAVQP